MLRYFFIWQADMAAAGLEPCGMFTPTHLLVTALCLALVAFFVYRSRGMTERALDRVTLCIAILTAALECGKIAFNWAHGGLTPNNWLPLTFCSFAIYAYFMIALGRGRVRQAGLGFAVGGGIVAGLTFLIIPMTSVASYPMLHFQSLYSMLYHSLMMYVGLAYLINGYARFDMAGYHRYLLFALPACLLALAVNLVYGLFDDFTLCNMMFLVYPYRLSDLVPFIGTVYAAAPAVYTLGAMAVYLTVPFFVPYGMTKLPTLIRRQ